MADVRDRAVGGILGLALGDALGAPFEFRRREAIPSPLPAFELAWMGLAPGTWTDDTAMARNLWTSLISTGGVLDLDDVLTRHLAWLATGPPDVGNLTRKVLSGWRDAVSEDPARDYVEQRGPEVSAGNGSVMYCAPLGVVRAFAAERLLTEAPALSALTHWDERCRTACLAITLAIAGLVRGELPDAAILAAVAAVADREGGEELEYLAAEAGLRDVVAFGGDTDTNAAVAGALLGARFGGDGLPGAWLAKLADREAIQAEGEAFAALIG